MIDSESAQPGALFRFWLTNLLRGEMMGQLTKQFTRSVEGDSHLLNLWWTHRKFMREWNRLPDSSVLLLSSNEDSTATSA